MPIKYFSIFKFFTLISNRLELSISTSIEFFFFFTTLIFLQVSFFIFFFLSFFLSIIRLSFYLFFTYSRVEVNPLSPPHTSHFNNFASQHPKPLLKTFPPCGEAIFSTLIFITILLFLSAFYIRHLLFASSPLWLCQHKLWRSAVVVKILFFFTFFLNIQRFFLSFFSNLSHSFSAFFLFFILIRFSFSISF